MKDACTGLTFEPAASRGQVIKYRKIMRSALRSFFFLGQQLSSECIQLIIWHEESYLFLYYLFLFCFLIKSCFDVKVLIDFSPFVYFFYDSGTALIFSMFKNMLTLCSPKSKLPYDATANNNRGQSHIKQQVSTREEPEPCDWQILMQSLIGVWEEACMRVRLYVLYIHCTYSESETLI